MLGDRNNKRRLENLCVSRIEFMHELLAHYRTQNLDSLFLNQKKALLRSCWCDATGVCSLTRPFPNAGINVREANKS
jgi:hypothetical protein